MNAKSFKVDMLARVEGEGGFSVKIKDQHVKEVKLNIFEPPRFFEAFLRGRHFAVYLPLKGKDVCRVIAIMGEPPDVDEPN